jgi:hypothetical protein
MQEIMTDILEPCPLFNLHLIIVSEIVPDNLLQSEIMIPNQG